jgi:DNA-dependent RNA polymerase auxiliary subunit epsilon
MSQWLTIKKQEDVELDESPMTEATIDVYVGSDYMGANYVTIPVSFILKVLRDNKYYIEEIPG